MEFNRLVSLVLGFIVLILIFVWISNRFRSNTETVTVNGEEVTVTPTYTPTPDPEEENRGFNPLSFLFNRDQDTPTPTPTVGEGEQDENGMIAQITSTPTTSPVEVRVVEGDQQADGNGDVIVYTNNANGASQQNGDVQQIPETGAATAIVPLSLSILAGGIYLRKRA